MSKEQSADGFRRKVTVGGRTFYIVLSWAYAEPRPRIFKTLPGEHRVRERPGERVISPGEAAELKKVILEMLGTE